MQAFFKNVLNAQLAGFSADDLERLIDLLRRFIANGPETLACGAGPAPAPDTGNA